MNKENTPKVIYNVSQTQFSIARYYGGIVFNGRRYEYNEDNDTLILIENKKKSRK